VSSYTTASTATNSSQQQQQQENNYYYSNTITAMVPFQKQTSFKLRVPYSRNPHGSDAVHPDRMKMKKQRKQRTAAAATSGAIVGGVLFGPAWPLGVVVGGAAGAVAGKRIAKAGERRAQRKYEQESFQTTALSKSQQWSRDDGAVFA
jgi:hypothetical protein